MPDFSRRSEEVEVMDDLACKGEVVQQTLRELETINKLLGGNYVTLDGLDDLVRKNKSRSLRIADLGCGSGDILRLIRKWTDRRGIDAQLTGYDANPFIVEYARTHTPSVLNIQYRTINIFSEEFAKQEFDVVTGTLFFHHFSDSELPDLFRRLKDQARLGIVINDIHRHWFAFHSIRWLTKLFSRSSMVKYDAPLSVLRAFRKNELVAILRKAGIANYTIRWMWAFRWQIVVYCR